jgi:DNA-binding response OmpR family regulator
MFTALSDVSDKSTGLDLGADDYISKPFRDLKINNVWKLSYIICSEIIFNYPLRYFNVLS